jgi:hypothetical protein
MSAEFTSHLPAVRARIDQAIRAGLIAAALVLVNELKKVFTTKGYTSGAFRNTLLRRNRVRHSEVTVENGTHMIRVGVLSGERVTRPDGKPSKATVGEIMLYWEIGGINRFTRKYERVEIFRPTALAVLPQMHDAFARKFRQVMAA